MCVYVCIYVCMYVLMHSMLSPLLTSNRFVREAKLFFSKGSISDQV